jgi:hypothetical protein
VDNLTDIVHIRRLSIIGWRLLDVLAVEMGILSMGPKKKMTTLSKNDCNYFV